MGCKASLLHTHIPTPHKPRRIDAAGNSYQPLF